MKKTKDAPLRYEDRGRALHAATVEVVDTAVLSLAADVRLHFAAVGGEAKDCDVSAAAVLLLARELERRRERPT